MLVDAQLFSKFTNQPESAILEKLMRKTEKRRA